jgi:hypothetical protein
MLGLILRRSHAIALVALTAVCAAIQAYFGLTSRRISSGQPPFDVGQAIRVFVQYVIENGSFGHIRTPPGWVVATGIVTVCGVAVVRYLLARARVEYALERADLRKALFVTIGIVAVGSATFFVTIYLQRAYNARYTYMASALLVCALVFGAALLGRGASTRPATGHGLDRWTWWAARLALPIAAFVLAVGFARSFRLETRSSDGPDFFVEYAGTAPNCSSGATSIRVPISPIGADNWTIEIPCDRVVASP